MRQQIDRAIQTLSAYPETVGFAGQLLGEYQAAKSKASNFILLSLLGLLVGVSLVAFLIAMIGDLSHLLEVAAIWPLLIVGYVVAAPIQIAVAIVAVVVAAVQLRRLYLRHRLCALLDSFGNPVADQVRETISTRSAEVLYRALNLVLPITMAVIGLGWAAVVWLGTTSALDCAKSSKCL